MFKVDKEESSVDVNPEIKQRRKHLNIKSNQRSYVSALIVLPESFWVICPCSFPASKSKSCSITTVRQEEMDSETGCRQGFWSQDKKHLLTMLIKMPQCTLPGTHKEVNTSLEKTLECDFLSHRAGTPACTNPLLSHTPWGHALGCFDSPGKGC